MQDSLTLTQYLRAGKPGASRALAIVRAAAGQLRVLHEGGTPHLGLDPDTILVNPNTDAVTLLPHVTGSLPTQYIAPEQTGRVSRAPDFRTDIYALGCLAFHLLAGHPPWSERTPANYAFAVLTEPLPFPDDFPDAWRAIVSKLMARDMDDRFADAVSVLAALSKWDMVADDKALLRLPAKLFGRDSERSIVQRAGAMARQGHSQWILLRGKSGVGKSAIALAYLREVRDTAWCGRGKCEMAQQQTPYAALGQVVATLVQHVFMQGPEAIERWRKRMATALGAHGQLLREMFPDLVALIPEQPAVGDLAAGEREARFGVLFARLIGTLAISDRPVVLFIDDTQWADAASLHLLSNLRRHLADAPVLFLLACRDEAVTPAVQASLDMVAAAQGHDVAVLGLTAAPLTDYVAATLGAAAERCEPLAKLLLQRCQGNVFAMQSLLRQLPRMGLLTFNAITHAWDWNVGDMGHELLTGDAQAFWRRELEGLPEAHKSVVIFAAQMGTEWDLEVLAQAASVAPVDMQAIVDDVLTRGLVTHDGGTYRFAHDSILEAAQHLAPGITNQSYHARLAALMLMRPRSVSQTFAAANHINLAGPPVDGDVSTRVSLNMEAANFARQGAAFAAARHYLEVAHGHLPAPPIGTPDTLWQQVQLDLAECTGLTGDIDTAEALFAELDECLNDKFERALVQARRVEMFDTLEENHLALQAGVRALRLLGQRLPLTPRWWHQIGELGRVLFASLRMDAATALQKPTLRDPHALLILRIFCRLLRPAFYAGPAMTNICTARMSSLTLRLDSSQFSAVGYSAYTVAGIIVRRPALTRAYAQVSEAISRRYPDTACNAQASFIRAAFAEGLFVPIRENINTLERCYNECIESGNSQWSSYSAFDSALRQVYMSAHLHKLADYCRHHGQVASRHPSVNPASVLLSIQNAAVSLSRRFNADISSVTSLLQGAPLGFIDGSRGVECFHAYMRGDIAAAHDMGLQLYHSIFKTLRRHITVSQFCLFFGLTVVSVLPTTRGFRRIKLRRALRRCHAELRWWGREGAVNYRGDSLLLEAAIAKLHGRTERAQSLLQDAIAWYEAAQFAGKAALACEEAMKFYTALNMPVIAQAFYERALRHYHAWGATAKADHFKAAWQHLQPDAAPSAELAPVMTQSSDTLATELDLSKLIRRLMQELMELTSATRGVLMLMQHDQLHVAFDSAAAHPANLSLEAYPTLPLRVVHYVKQARQPIVLEHAAAHETFGLDPYLVEGAIRSLLCAPLLHQGVLLGAYYLENNTLSGMFTTHHLHAANHLATQIAVSLQNALLYADLENRVTQRSAELEAANRRLVALEKAALEVQMAGGFAHEMRNALSAADAFAASVLDARGPDARSVAKRVRKNLVGLKQYAATLPQEQSAPLLQKVAKASRQTRDMQEVIEGMRRCVGRVLRTTTEVLDYTTLGNSPIYYEPVNVAATAREAVEEIKRLPAANNLTWRLNLPQSLTVSAHQDHVFAIVTNLLRNAYDATVTRHAPTIEVSVEDTETGWLLRVTDTGCGMSAQVQRRMFEPFFTTKPTTGKGLGLAMVRKMVDLHGGQLRCDSRVNGGTTISILFAKDPARPASPQLT